MRKKDGISYIDRVGAYAIIFSNDNKVAVVKTSTGYFLLGGGIEHGENHKDCIKRECLEEAGIKINIKDFICKGGKYHWSDTLKYYIHNIGYFYLADLIGKISKPTEKDHRLVWLDIDDYYNKLFLDHQAWAVHEALIIFNLKNYRAY